MADLASMFDLDMDRAEFNPAPVNDALCFKCHGKGKFVSYTGRVVGNCFTCNGSGLARPAAAPAAAKDGDCAKCYGSGEWRPGRNCFACNGTGKTAAAATAISVAQIEAAFSAARANGIKTPKLRLDSFTFSRAPDHGRNAGSLYVKQGGEYLGKVTGGKFAPTMACDAATAANVVAVAADPANAAKAYGMRTGSCSCCGRELTNGLSVELGIGPICRDKFGWGG
jgi:hypothetical protein